MLLVLNTESFKSQMIETKNEIINVMVSVVYTVLCTLCYGLDPETLKEYGHTVCTH